MKRFSSPPLLYPGDSLYYLFHHQTMSSKLLVKKIGSCPDLTRAELNDILNWNASLIVKPVVNSITKEGEVKKVAVFLTVLVFLFLFVVSCVSAQPSERASEIKSEIARHKNTIQQLKAELKAIAGTPGEGYGEEYGKNNDEEVAYEQTEYVEGVTAPYEASSSEKQRSPKKPPYPDKDRRPGLKEWRGKVQGQGKGPGLKEGRGKVQGQGKGPGLKEGRGKVQKEFSAKSKGSVNKSGGGKNNR